ncbi:Gfo/Idh/MocA family protein [Ovoidimarina sediminis]|uniref:Gfo/Idh/MocA family protein n=1 Tax=Ovoidimarina sediminis TaxID=3079856 RepID=UPI00290E080A|nr:Gfo/Idh/MocA family oxidoreductase [Rhodophyticola sp. MJ-SS7]MDU8943244.1 Gfo/Idh/MocA family oxidoreductase [Rhodophyticola sp. MJ-SS7]
MADPLRTAIVGAGIGAQHLEAYRALPDRFEVTAICDLDLFRTRAIAGELTVTDDFESLLADPDLDIVDICLPPHLHTEAILASLAAGKHTICEKPLATSLAEIDRIEVAEAASTARVFPVFQYRFGPAARALSALRDGGFLGTPLAAALETHWNRGGDYYAVPWRGTWAGEMGGAILGHAIHAHDWLSFAMGPVASVFARLATRANPIEVEDCAALALTLTDGTPVTSSVTLGAASDTTRIRLVYQNLTAESGTNPYKPAEGEWAYLARDPTRQPEVDAIVASSQEGPNGYAGLFAAISDALSGAPSGPVTLADARASIELVTAIYASARDDRPVSLPVASGEPFRQSWLPAL